MRANSGFTLIELMCVIVIVGSLSASAIPAFIDFRNEARRAVIAEYLRNARTAIKNAKYNAIVRCGAPADYKVGHGQVIFNNLTAVRHPSYHASVPVWQAPCNGKLNPNSPEARIFEPITNTNEVGSSYDATGGMYTNYKHIPNNPFMDPNQFYGHYIVYCTGAQCTNRSLGCFAPYAPTLRYGWCMDQNTGDIWSNYPGTEDL